MAHTLTDIRRAYDLASEAYAEIFLDELRHKPRDRELLQQFATLVGKGYGVLDLGCGPGHTTAHLNALGLNPIGIDLSPKMVAKAATLFPGLAFAAGDFFQLPYRNASIRGVLAFYCIVHLQPEQLTAAFSEMCRVLVAGGALLLSFHVGDEIVRVNSFLDTGAALEFSLFAVDQIRSALVAAGFTGIEIHERSPYDSEHPTTRGYVFGYKPTVA